MAIEAHQRPRESSPLHVAALGLGSVGLAGFGAGVALSIDIVVEARAGGIGSFAVFAIPYAAAMLGLAILVMAIAKRVARGAMLRTAAVVAVVVASITLIVAVNGQWFQDPLLFETRRCGAKSCFVSKSAPAPPSLNLRALPVAIWGLIAGIGLVADRLRRTRRRRGVWAWIAVGCIVIGAAGLGGLAEGKDAMLQARRACATVLAAEAGFDLWVRPQEAIPALYLERCADPVSLARSQAD